MGGYGSSRWNGVRTRPITIQCLRLELDSHIRSALKTLEIGLNQGKNGGGLTVRRWSCRGRPSGSIGLKLAGIVGRGLVAEVLYQAGDEQVDEFITIAQTPQKLGGSRAWWVCPGCHRRCCILYCPNHAGATRFRCRMCHNLGYVSQAESDKDVYWLARQIEGGDMPDPALFGAMNCRGLIITMKALDIVKRRRARALVRDQGKRWAKKHPWMLEV